MGVRRRQRARRSEQEVEVARARSPVPVEERLDPVLQLQRDAGNHAVATELAVARDEKTGSRVADTDTLTLDGIGEIPLDAWARWADDLYRIYPTRNPFEGVLLVRNLGKRLKEAKIVAHGGALDG